VRIVDLRRSTLEDVARIADELRVDGIVVGLPKGLAGGEGFQARAIRAMAAELESHVNVPVIFWDERMSSAIADQALAEAGRSPRERRKQLDAIAAAIMLQSYVDANPIRRATSNN
jgi:putative Holliday junction resolvase